jgi:hypothetical protein
MADQTHLSPNSDFVRAIVPKSGDPEGRLELEPATVKAIQQHVPSE